MTSANDLERWDSINSVSESYDSVPYDIKFKIKLMAGDELVDRFKYTLRKGKALPATVKLSNSGQNGKVNQNILCLMISF